MAVTLDAATFADRIGGRTEDADANAGILAAAADLVQAYAPSAPDGLHNEAAIRVGGYLATADYGAVAEQEFGSNAVRYRYVTKPCGPTHE